MTSSKKKSLRDSIRIIKPFFTPDVVAHLYRVYYYDFIAEMYKKYPNRFQW